MDETISLIRTCNAKWVAYGTSGPLSMRHYRHLQILFVVLWTSCDNGVRGGTGVRGRRPWRAAWCRVCCVKPYLIACPGYALRDQTFQLQGLRVYPVLGTLSGCLPRVHTLMMIKLKHFNSRDQLCIQCWGAYLIACPGYAP